MSRDIVIGLDAGTSVVKSVAFDTAGKQLAVAARPNRYERGPSGAVEQDMARTWQDAAASLRDLAEMIDDLPRRVLALAVTGQGDGTWLIDRTGEPAAPAWLWLDSRAASLVEEFDRRCLRKEAYRYTGCGLNACQQSAQLAWLKRHKPEVLDRAATAMHCKDWLYFKLTGVRATDPSEGTFTFGDFRRRRYAPEVLEALDIADLRHLLPEMIDGTERSDPLSAVEDTGLPDGTPVVLGYLDVMCTALGGGLYAPGQTVGCSIVGSTGMHMRLFENAESIQLAAEPTGYSMPFPLPGHIAQMQSNMAATLNIDWIVDVACQAAEGLGATIDRKAALPTIDARVLEARPGAALFHPYIDQAGERGPFVDANARAQFTGLSQDVGFFDLVRSVYEGLALAARDCYGAMGHRPSEVRITGGAARSRALKQILASVLGTPIRESAREEAGAAGAAMIALQSVGAVPDMDAACATWVDPLLGETIASEPELVGLYDQLFSVYRDIHQQMPDVWRQLSEAREVH